ncbi:hypothetical protein ACFUN8_13155 [Streptomyces sp. NPDC057307]|uniref:hypothetical protein n=1 Tax=Streptomyces sp. NPDC057307 TaxID=3346096 RepID=UPI003627F089
MAGLRVCATCRERIRKSLAELPKLYLDCEAILGRRPRPMNAERVSGSKVQGLPINEAAAKARTNLVRVTAAWAGMVADEFDTPRPGSRAVDELALFLARQLDRLLAHPAAGDFAAELFAVVRAARRAAYAGTARRLDVGSCTHAGCDSRITVRVHGHDFSPHHVLCDAGHTWPAQQWLMLAHRLERVRRTQGLQQVGRAGGGR